MEVYCGATSKTIIQFEQEQVKSTVYLYMGAEESLEYQAFNGLYAIKKGQITQNDIDYIQNEQEWSSKGVLNRLSVNQYFGTSYTRKFESENNKMISKYSIKLRIKINGTFPIKQQIFRMTLDDMIYDELKLGYCLACISIFKQKLIFETYSYEIQNGQYTIQKQIYDEFPNVLLEKNYEFVLQYDGNQFTISDGKMDKKINVKQFPILSFSVIHGGNFISDSQFSGQFLELNINYGMESILQGNNLSQFKQCKQKLCSTCDINGETCELCLLSESDPNKISEKCECNESFYFDLNKKCSQCHSTCQTCTGTQKSDCIKCIETRVLQKIMDQENGFCNCQERYFDDGYNPQCKQCHKDCLVCVGTEINQCKSCSQGRNVNEQGQCVCKSNFYYEDNVCKQCKIECATCNNTQTCLTCHENQQIDQTTKLCRCNEGFYSVQEDEKMICKPCTDECLQCSGPGVSQCKVCKYRYQLYEAGESSCIRKKYIETIEFKKSYFQDNKEIIQYCMISVVVIDFFANIYANKYSFSRIFRMQQFILKIFYLKLIDADFLESNYQLLNSLCFLNGITNVYSYLNPFAQIKTPPGSQVGSKIKLEEVPSSILQSSGGVIFIEILIFIGVLILTLLVKWKTQQKAPQRSSFLSNPNDNSMQIDRPMISQRDEISDKQLSPNNNSINQNINNNYDLLQKTNIFVQNLYWHFHEYGLNIICFGSVLHLVGSSQEPEEVRPENFISYLFMLYVVSVCLIWRSFVIRKPKQKEDFQIYKNQAIENEKILKEKKRLKEEEAKKAMLGIQEGKKIDESSNSPQINNGNSPIIFQRPNRSLQHQSKDGNNKSSENDMDNESADKNNEQKDNKYIELVDYNSSQSDQGLIKEKKRVSVRQNYRKQFHLLQLNDSICLKGIFECLHMEFIPSYKGCKFYFWIYILNYVFIAAAVIGPRSQSDSQYTGLCLIQLVFMIVSFFRPYQDILESIKNIIDNVIFFIVTVLQFILSYNVRSDIKDFRLTGTREDELNRYSWTCFSLLLLAMISLMTISICQVIQRRNDFMMQQQNNESEESNIQKVIEQQGLFSSEGVSSIQSKKYSEKDKMLAEQFKNRNQKVQGNQINKQKNYQSSTQNQSLQRKSSNEFKYSEFTTFELNKLSIGPAQFDNSNQFMRNLQFVRQQKIQNTNQSLNSNQIEYEQTYQSFQFGQQAEQLNNYEVSNQIFSRDYNNQINYNGNFNFIQNLQQQRQIKKFQSEQTSTQNVQIIEMQNFQQKVINSNQNSDQKLNNPEDNENNSPTNNQILEFTNSVDTLEDCSIFNDQNILTKSDQNQLISE